MDGWNKRRMNRRRKNGWVKEGKKKIWVVGRKKGRKEGKKEGRNERGKK